MAIILRRRKLGRTSCEEIAKLSPNLKVVRNDRAKQEDFVGQNWVFRWGCTSTVPASNVVNTASAIHQVNDKLGFRRILNDAGLCPPTWFNIMEVDYTKAPFIVRPSVHSRGRHCYYAVGLNEANNFAYLCGDNYYISEYIPKVAEYRVCVVQGRVAWVAKKTPSNPDDIAWNVANGGRFDNVRWNEWNLRAVRVAVEAFNLSKLDFGGVDVMVAPDGHCYILEINSAPSLTSPYRQECMAKCFDWIVNNGKKRIPLIEGRGGYRKFIHPAVCQRAILVEN